MTKLSYTIANNTLLIMNRTFYTIGKRARCDTGVSETDTDKSTVSKRSRTASDDKVSLMGCSSHTL